MLGKVVMDVKQCAELQMMTTLLFYITYILYMNKWENLTQVPTGFSCLLL